MNSQYLSKRATFGQFSENHFLTTSVEQVNMFQLKMRMVSKNYLDDTLQIKNDLNLFGYQGRWSRGMGINPPLFDKGDPSLFHTGKILSEECI